jgi:S1-C subfamily serine protease
VAPNSRAANAGLRSGDVIVAANGVRIANTAGLSGAWRAAAARGGSTLVLQVRRSGDISILVLR